MRDLDTFGDELAANVKKRITEMVAHLVKEKTANLHTQHRSDADRLVTVKAAKAQIVEERDQARAGLCLLAEALDCKGSDVDGMARAVKVLKTTIWGLEREIRVMQKAKAQQVS
jgi:hypothetical protein